MWGFSLSPVLLLVSAYRNSSQTLITAYIILNIHARYKDAPSEKLGSGDNVRYMAGTVAMLALEYYSFMGVLLMNAKV